MRADERSLVPQGRVDGGGRPGQASEANSFKKKQIREGGLGYTTQTPMESTHAHVLVIEVLVVIHSALVHASSAAASAATSAHPFPSASGTPATASI